MSPAEALLLIAANLLLDWPRLNLAQDKYGRCHARGSPFAHSRRPFPKLMAMLAPEPHAAQDAE